MSETKWEAGPWRNEIEYNSAGYVARVRVYAAESRSVTVTTFTGLKRNRIGELVPTPDAKSDTQTSDHPACVADCGIPYAGLAAETLVAHGDLIAAAPELYEALEALCFEIEDNNEDQQEPHYVDVQKARAALAKARGESPDAK